MAGGSIPSNLKPLFVAAGKQYGIPASVLAGVASVETNLGRNRGPSSAGAVGLMQFEPATARGIGINPYDDRQAIFGAAKLLVQFGYHSNPLRALGAYNGGPGNPQYGYANQVMSQARQLAGELNGIAPSTTSIPPTSTGPSALTSTITTGGVPDVQAALKAALTTQLQRPINVTTGKLPSGDSFLKNLNFNLDSGQYLTPQVNHTLNAPLSKASSPASSGQTSLPANSGQYPVGVGTFDGKQVALWIIPILQYARSHGWNGSVTSGYRSYADQKRIYDSGVRPAAVPGTSNHESNRFPGGAVDVSNASGLSAILRRSPYASVLIWAGTKDPVHFSHPHNGSY